MDFVVFKYNKNGGSVKVLPCEDVFDAQALFDLARLKLEVDDKTISNEHDFIRIMICEVYVTDVENLISFLDLDITVKNNKITWNDYIRLTDTMLNYSIRQRFWTMFTNDEQAKLEEETLLNEIGGI